MIQPSVHSHVAFQIDDPLLQRLFDTAEKKLQSNLQDFGGRPVLIEGAEYRKIWLETQPMGGEMYAKRHMEAALNNQLLFMEHQRADGRLPGSIMLENGKVVPQFNKFQGFCFPAPALNMYYWAQESHDYLRLLQNSLKRFDAYLWRVRDSNGDGLLESWCVYDTGEDNALRYGDAPCWWEEDAPPNGYDVVPMASMDIMSFSYAARAALAKISTILQDGQNAHWKSLAKEVSAAIEKYFWAEDLGACFDRDRHGRQMPTLTHNNLRCMYWGSFSQPMADRFVKDHLLNSEEFWTGMPLPSVAANDPLFRNNSGNDWSGQPEGLTYQRAISALENYGYHHLIPLLGHRLFKAIGSECKFTQQFDTFTGQPSSTLDGYGPTMLAVLEYMSRMYGVHVQGQEIWWGAIGNRQCTYTQEWGDRRYTLISDTHRVTGTVNGKEAFSLDKGLRVVTDYDGNIVKVIK